MNRNLNEEIGLALLETALSLSILLPLLCAAWGLADYLQRTAFVEDVLEKNFHGAVLDSIRPGVSAEQLDTRLVNSQLSHLALALGRDFEQIVRNKAAYSVRGAYAEIEIEPVAGKIRKISAHQYGVAGDLVCDDARNKAADPIAALETEARRMEAAGALSLYSIDSLDLADSESSNLTSRIVLVAMTGIVSAEDNVLIKILPENAIGRCIVSTKIASTRER